MNHDNPKVSVIILTYNEQANIGFALDSLRDLTDEVFIVDSFSTDKTVEIARSYTDKIYQNPWDGWATQRNWALTNLPISSEWVFFLDADEQVTPEFWEELRQTINMANVDLAALNVRFDFFFLGRKLRFAYESPPVLRVIRRGKATWKGEGAREYAAVEGRVITMKSRLLHHNHKELALWVRKQTENAMQEARLTKTTTKEKAFVSSDANISRSNERLWRRVLRDNVWNKLPRYWRPFAYFFYRYIIRGGILDGRAGFAYCFLQGLWYQLLIDILIDEKQQKRG